MTAGDANESRLNLADGKAGFASTTVSECFENCSYKCNGTCIKDPHVCGACSHADRTAPACECKDGFYDDGSNAACVALPTNCG